MNGAQLDQLANSLPHSQIVTHSVSNERHFLWRMMEERVCPHQTISIAVVPKDWKPLTTASPDIQKTGRGQASLQ